MIGPLARDAARLFLRGRTAPLMLACGALAGLFIRTTRVAGTLHVHGQPSDGGATEIEMLASSAFVAALLFGVVSGLVLAAEDRGTGFLAQLAVRPVGRVRYALGRIGGVALAAAGGIVLFLLAATPCAGIRFAELPEARTRASPVSVAIDGREVEAGAVVQLAPGNTARFAFDADAAPDVIFQLHPRVVRGGGFDGTVEIDATWTLADGRTQTRALPLMRSFRELPLRFDGNGDADVRGPFTLDATLKSAGCVVEIDTSALGGVRPLPVQLLVAFLLLWCGAALLAAIGFVLGLGLAPGPASLAAGFLLLIGAGRAAVLDIIAGIGVAAASDAHHANGGAEHDAAAPAPSAATWRFVRIFLGVLTRLVPDLARFDPSERLGVAEAITSRSTLAAVGTCGAVLAACLVLAALVAPFKER